MRIAFFIGGMSRGGAERVISRLANYYMEKGWSVDILMLLNTTVEYELSPKIRLIDLTCSNSSYIKNSFQWIYRIRKYVRSQKPDRIVSFIGRINALVLTATLGMQVNILVSERNDPKQDGRGNLMLRYCNLLYRRARMVVFQNHYEQTCFSKQLKSVIINNPVSVDCAKTGETAEPIIVSAGRLTYQKNQRMIIEALPFVLKTIPNVKLYIYGEGNLRDELECLINHLGLQNNVFLPGNIKNIHEKMSEGTVFVLTSLFEGASNALLEAMMIGIPVVSTDYPGIREIIQDSVNGELVSIGDINALADSIIKIFQDQTHRNMLKKQALQTVENYSYENVISRWESVIG